MSLLKAEPAAPVKSLEELFAIAAAMEHEAATRYAEIAARMRREGNPGLAEVFERLSADERGHLDSVAEWSRKTKGQEPDPARIRWELPQTFDDEGMAAGDPRLLSAYRALSMAVRNEERAFAFWTYVAAHAGSSEIGQAAEAMAREELGHVSTLRRERRKAFHAERPQGQTRQPNEGSGADLDIAALERRMADLLEPLAAGAPSGEADRLRQFAAEARRQAENLARAPGDLFATRGPAIVPETPVALAEMLADRYLEAADRLRDEDAVAQAQALASLAINRLAWLRADLPELSRT